MEEGLINISDFKAGRLVQQREYKSFSPHPICRSWICTNTEINELLGEANRKIGALDAYASLIPDVDFFIKMHIAKEATTSSKIEGTQTSFEEAFIDEKDVDPEKRDDWQEVNNYITAMNFAQSELNKLPLSGRLIKQTHQILLNNARGKQKLPGEYRSSQNWIGPSLKHAQFIPPHFEEIPDLMTDLETFIHSEIQSPVIVVPQLIKIALLHYQFETIHPFLDGNGRIGRLLITLYLLEKKLLQQPTLYLSDYLEKNRLDYYALLTKVRAENAMQDWIKFFLIGVIETASNSIGTFKKIIELREQIEFEILPKLGKTQKAGQQLIQNMYKNPIASGKQIAAFSKQHPSNANKLIQKLVNLDILIELTGYRRNRIFSFMPYVKIFVD